MSERLTSVDQILGRSVWEGFNIGNHQVWGTYQFPNPDGSTQTPDAWADHWRSSRIVGIVNFDLSAYESLMPLERQTERATAEQRTLARQAADAVQIYHNNYFALPGYYQNLMRHNFHRFLQNNIEISLTLPDAAQTTGEVVNGALNTVLLDSFVKPGGWHPHWYADAIQVNGFDPADLAPYYPDQAGYEKKQVVVDTKLLASLLPDDVLAQYEDVDELLEGTHILNGGAKLHFSINSKIGGVPVKAQLNDYDIVAVYPEGANAFYPTQNFYDALIVYPTATVFVPVSTSIQRMNILTTLEQNGRFTQTDELGEEIVLNFVVWSNNAKQIYFVGNMFSLFVNIFSLASIVFALFAIFLTYSFIASSINAQKKDIGILRSLGASRKDIVGIFTLEGIFIAVLMILFGSLTCYGMFLLLDYYFIATLGTLAVNYTLVSFGLRQIILMALITVLGIAISITLPIIRIAKKQPIEVIREDSD